MKHIRYIIALLSALLSAGPGFVSGQAGSWCATDAYHLRYLNENPDAQVRWEQLHALHPVYHFIQDRNVLEIPVVVHVVYRTEEQNIPTERILEQIDILNAALQSSNTGHPGVPQIFKPFAAAMGIRLCLSEVLPGGKSAWRITRQKTTLRDIGKNDKQKIKHRELGGVDAWDPDKYLNIWIGEIGNNILGYSSFPDIAGMPEDGIVLEVRYLSHKHSPYNLSRTLIHEMGHYLGLCHLPGCFAASCEVDDKIDDTPNQSVYYNQELCPETPQISCKSIDMYMNYMALVPDKCLLMFTRGQVKSARFLLNAMRPGLLENNCSEISSYQVWHHHMKCYFSGREHAIIIESDKEAPEGWHVRLFSAGGQLICTKNISYRKRLKIKHALPQGIYIVYFYGPQSNFFKNIIAF